MRYSTVLHVNPGEKIALFLCFPDFSRIKKSSLLTENAEMRYI
jgi:hypothetical protein